MKNIIAKLAYYSLLFCSILSAAQSSTLTEQADTYWRDYRTSKKAGQVKNLAQYIGMLSNPDSKVDDGTALHTILSKPAAYKASALRWFHATGGKAGFRAATQDEQIVLKGSLIYIALNETTEGYKSLLDTRRDFGIQAEKDEFSVPHLLWAQRILSSARIITDAAKTHGDNVQKEYKVYADTSLTLHPPRKTPPTDIVWNGRLKSFVDKGLTQELITEVTTMATALKLNDLASSISSQNLDTIQHTVFETCKEDSEHLNCLAAPATPSLTPTKAAYSSELTPEAVRKVIARSPFFNKPQTSPPTNALIVTRWMLEEALKAEERDSEAVAALFSPDSTFGKVTSPPKRSPGKTNTSPNKSSGWSPLKLISRILPGHGDDEEEEA